MLECFLFTAQFLELAGPTWWVDSKTPGRHTWGFNESLLSSESPRDEPSQMYRLSSSLLPNRGPKSVSRIA